MLEKRISGWFAAILVLCVLGTGCNAQQEAIRWINAITAMQKVVASAIPDLPAADQSKVTNWTNQWGTLDTQASTCIGGLGTLSKSSSFLACFNAFATGFTSATEQAGFGISNPTTQSRITSWVTLAVVIVNGAVSYFGGNAVTPPVISAGVQPDQQELRRDVAILSAQFPEGTYLWQPAY